METRDKDEESPRWSVPGERVQDVLYVGIVYYTYVYTSGRSAWK